MKEQEVDVLCFQECGDNKYFPMDSIRNVFSHWRYALIPTEDSIRGVLPIAVFSRYPLVNPQFISYQQSANCSMQCDIILGRDTVRLLNNHLQTTSVSQNRRKWERGLANSNDTRREAEVVQGAITSLHDNFVKRAEQTDSIRQLVVASPYPYWPAVTSTPCHPPTPMPNCPMSSKTASAPAAAVTCTPTATSNACCASTTYSIRPASRDTVTTRPIWTCAATIIRC